MNYKYIVMFILLEVGISVSIGMFISHQFTHIALKVASVIGIFSAKLIAVYLFVLLFKELMFHFKNEKGDQNGI